MMVESFEYKTLGFIGLGAMGKPMLEHLANKLPKESCIWVYDVVEQILDETCAAYPNRVFKGSSAKDVAQHVVCSAPVGQRSSQC
jgi:pyrroline-5-carboxylate reductase